MFSIRTASRILGFLVTALLSIYAATSQAAPLKPVTYLLPSFASSPAFAPWIIARAKGYYAQAGLEVNFVACKGGLDVARRLHQGEGLAGGAMGETSIIARDQGLDVRAIAILGGGAFTQLAVHEDSDIHSLAGLKGKSVAVMSNHDTSYYGVLMALRVARTPREQVDIQALGSAGVWQNFATHRVDAMAATPDWVVRAERSGARVRLLEEKTFHGMAQAILASERAIADDPETLKAFTAATLAGMQDIMQSPRAAAEVFASAMPSANKQVDALERIFALYAERVYRGQERLGSIPRQRLADIQRLYHTEGLIREERPVDSLFWAAAVPAR
ncbi:MAG TPA: ABC transporter substrate-binding protein [Pseudomonas sp.]